MAATTSLCPVSSHFLSIHLFMCRLHSYITSPIPFLQVHLGLLLFLFPLGFHSKTRFDYLSFINLLTRPNYKSCLLFTSSAISLLICMLFLMSTFRFLSRQDIPRLCCQMSISVDNSFLLLTLLIFHTSTPYNIMFCSIDLYVLFFFVFLIYLSQIDPNSEFLSPSFLYSSCLPLFDVCFPFYGITLLNEDNTSTPLTVVLSNIMSLFSFKPTKMYSEFAR